MRYNSEDFIVEAVADIYEDYQIGELNTKHSFPAATGNMYSADQEESEKTRLSNMLNFLG